jgi:hypothetical protein
MAILRRGLCRAYPCESRAYTNAKTRCTNTKNQDYHNYGGRGIKFRFQSFAEFFDHLGPKPTDNYQLDRIDSDGHYEPGNVRWVTPKENQRNRKTTKTIFFRGEIKPLGEWAEELGYSYDLLYLRLRRGWSVEKAFTTPVDHLRHPTFR